MLERRDIRGWFWVDFQPILSSYLRVLKAQTRETQGGDGFLAFLRENKLPLGGNTLGLVLGEVSRGKRKNT